MAGTQMYQQTSLSIETLPVEILRRVATFLPITSIYHLLLVNRKLHDVCNDWTVWRSAVKSSANFETMPWAGNDLPPRAWKSCAVADLKAQRCDCDDSIASWLPQMMAYHHHVLKRIDPMLLYERSDPTHYDRENGLFALEPSVESPHLLTNLASPIDLKTWQVAQAISFCLTARLLNHPLVSGEPKPKIQHQWGPREPLVEKIEFFFLDFSDRKSPAADIIKCATQLHALANRLVGFFSMELRAALVLNPPCSGRGIAQPVDWYYNPPWVGGWIKPIAELPTSFSIPFEYFMDLPPPLKSGAVEQFSTCHLRSMTNPQFFEDGDWGGYFCWTGFITGRGPGGSSQYDPIGVLSERLCSEAQWFNSPERLVDQYANFRLLRQISHYQFVLQSNTFRTNIGTHRLTLTVDTRTGYILIEHSSDGYVLGLRPAVITPFGIVAGLRRGSWLWMWKIAWPCRS
ncbi:MAG: hypothetical protein M1820_008504 [Bogoriella megaspora]|nr:MAG: hypothetical protein M1820_008504 [Bogoriella megaspora]